MENLPHLPKQTLHLRVRRGYAAIPSSSLSRLPRNSANSYIHPTVKNLADVSHALPLAANTGEVQFYHR